GEVSADAFGEASRVHEHDGRAMFADELCQAIVKLGPHFIRHDRLERRVGQLDREIALAYVSAVDDRATRTAVGVDVLRTDEKPCDVLDRFLRCRQADARESSTGERVETFQRDRKMRAALRAG